ncbi:hypothetical protein [Streptomyces sp. TRM70350]|uniref:hypothetical protein n=1 Tax=Streptomyces sp. TRM70350 TaxID=2856165 RepID=UPI001C443768|nr:hypothetical protein [Streptomyces sp. TRM70350]MBV7696191.1 hypothetical protein [Streptomyces sp. TRM70350]
MTLRGRRSRWRSPPRGRRPVWVTVVASVEGVIAMCRAKRSMQPLDQQVGQPVQPRGGLDGRLVRGVRLPQQPGQARTPSAVECVLKKR